jgi:hypothetical protein
MPSKEREPWNSPSNVVVNPFSGEEAQAKPVVQIPPMMLAFGYLA